MYHIIKDLWHLHGTGQKGPTTETDRGQAFISRGGISSTVGNLIQSFAVRFFWLWYLQQYSKVVFQGRSQYLNRQIWDLGYMVRTEGLPSMRSRGRRGNRKQQVYCSSRQLLTVLKAVRLTVTYTLTLCTITS